MYEVGDSQAAGGVRTRYLNEGSYAPMITIFSWRNTDPMDEIKEVRVEKGT